MEEGVPNARGDIIRRQGDGHLKCNDLKEILHTTSSDILSVFDREFIKPYYMLRRVPLASLLNFEFLSAFVKDGGLSVIAAYSPDK